MHSDICLKFKISTHYWERERYYDIVIRTRPIFSNENISEFLENLKEMIPRYYMYYIIACYIKLHTRVSPVSKGLRNFTRISSIIKIFNKLKRSFDHKWWQLQHGFVGNFPSLNTTWDALRSYTKYNLMRITWKKAHVTSMRERERVNYSWLWHCKHVLWCRFVSELYKKTMDDIEVGFMRKTK